MCKHTARPPAYARNEVVLAGFDDFPAWPRPSGGNASAETRGWIGSFITPIWRQMAAVCQ